LFPVLPSLLVLSLEGEGGKSEGRERTERQRKRKGTQGHGGGEWTRNCRELEGTTRAADENGEDRKEIARKMRLERRKRQGSGRAKGWECTNEEGGSEWEVKRREVGDWGGKGNLPYVLLNFPSFPASAQLFLPLPVLTRIRR